MGSVESIAFSPLTKVEDHKTYLGVTRIEDDVSILHIKDKGVYSKRVCILFAHGNGQTLLTCHQGLSIMKTIFKSAYPRCAIDLLTFEYPGTGTPQGSNLKDAIHACNISFNYLRKEYQTDQIILAGYSLGSSIILDLASRQHGYKALILLSPLASALNAFSRSFATFLPFMDACVNTEKIKMINCSTFISHGMNDTIISIENSRILKERFQDQSKLYYVELDECNHGNFYENDYWKTCIFEYALTLDLIVCDESIVMKNVSSHKYINLY
jgi:pimeloyl-ACP methyl ester carboxylesterase